MRSECSRELARRREESRTGEGERALGPLRQTHEAIKTGWGQGRGIRQLPERAMQAAALLEGFIVEG